MEISRKVFETIKKHSMLKEKDRVLVALSGGADSVCLLILLDEIKDKFKITLEAAHINHKLRGKAAERDMNFVGELCQKQFSMEDKDDILTEVVGEPVGM